MATQQPPFVALNVSLPREQKRELLALMKQNGFATVSEYIRALIRRERELKTSPALLNSVPPNAPSDAELLRQLSMFAPCAVVPEDSPAQKLLSVFQLRQRGIALTQEQLKRQFPAASEREIRMRIANWIRRRPGAICGDSPGAPNFERLAALRHDNLKSNRANS